MADVTEADRDKARELLRSIAVGLESTTVEFVARALAEEREKARAPFLALADAHERYANDWDDEYPEAADVLMDSAARIRRAVEEG